MEWTYPSVPEWKDLLLLLVSCGGQPIIGSVRTPVAYSIGIPFFHDAGARAKGQATERNTEHMARNMECRTGVANYTARTKLEIAYCHHASLRKDMHR